MKSLSIVFFILISAAICDAQNRVQYYGAIDLGSRGAKATLYTFATEGDEQVSEVIFSQRIDNSLVTSIENANLSRDQIVETSNSVKNLVDTMQKEAAGRDLEVAAYYIVGSSGVAKVQNRQELGAAIKAKTGIQMDFLSLAEEVYYGFLSAASPNHMLNTMYIDVGSGSTLVACSLAKADFAHFKNVEIAYGSISGRNEALKVSPDNFSMGIDKVVEDVRSHYPEQDRNDSCFHNPMRIYWSGGSAWATASFMHPEAAMRGRVTITRNDVDQFIAELKDGTWNHHVPVYNFPGGISSQQRLAIRDKAQKDREDVQNVFVREDLLAGLSILRTVLDAANPAATIRFVRNASYVYGYASAKFAGHASLNVFPQRIADMPAYTIYRLSVAQIQTLKSDATRLQSRASSLKDLFSSAMPPDTLMNSLRDAVALSLRELNEAERDIRMHRSSEGATHDPADAETARIFFDDLRIDYLTVLKAIEANHASTTSSFKVYATPVNFENRNMPGSDNGDPSLLANKSIDAIEENELAFTIAADSEDLTFDLRVKSTPEGAIIQYKRRGDQFFKKNPEGTDAVISHLPLAKWIVQIQAAGFEDQEIEHDPFRQSEHRIDAILQKVRK